MEDLIEQLRKASELEGVDRVLKVMAVLTLACERVDFMTPVLVGGAAVDVYTAGGYHSVDIDALLETPHPKVVAVMTGLGFTQYGKDWYHEDFKVQVEFPGSTSSDEYHDETTIDVDGVSVRIETIERALRYRLLSFELDYRKDGVACIALVAQNKDTIVWDKVKVGLSSKTLDLLERMRALEASYDWENPPALDKIDDDLYLLLNPGARLTMEEEDDDHE